MQLRLAVAASATKPADCLEIRVSAAAQSSGVAAGTKALRDTFVPPRAPQSSGCYSLVQSTRIVHNEDTIEVRIVGNDSIGFQSRIC